MVGSAVLVGVSLLAIAFLGVFLAAMCKERQHIKICMLLRQDPEESSTPVAALSSAAQLHEVAEPLQATSRIIVMPRRSRISVLQMRKPQNWSKVG
jgi:hypothetical protein